MCLKHPLLYLSLLLSSSAWALDECQLNLSESRLDLGQMKRVAVLTPNAEQLLGERRISLTLNCPNATDLSVFLRGLPAGPERYRFTERGSYGVQVSDAVLDGQAVELGLLPGSGQPPSTIGGRLSWRPEHAIVPLRGGVPVNGRHLALQLDVSAWAAAGAGKVRDAVSWETSGLFDALGAGRSRELSLLAHFAPAACTPSLSNGGTVDFGKLSIIDLASDRETALAPRSLVVGVTCDAPAQFALRMQDNRQGSATGPSDDTHYGLGLDARRQKIGRYSVSLDPARTTADSFAQVYRTESGSGGDGSWSNATAQPIALSASRYLGFAATAGSTGGPDPIQTLSTTASLQAHIAPLDQLDLGNEVLLDGSGTVELFYP